MVKQTTFQTTPGDQPAQALTVQTEGVVAVADSTSTTLLAANTNRRKVLIVNNTGAVFYISLSGTATTGAIPLRSGHQLMIVPDEGNYIYLGEITAYQESGGSESIFVLEEERS